MAAAAAVAPEPLDIRAIDLAEVGAEEEEKEAPPEEVAADEEAAECQDQAVYWAEVKKRLCPCGIEDSPEGWLLQSFAEWYGITSAVEALTNIKAFLAEYLIQEFDYKDWCKCCRKASEKVIEDDERWSRFVEDNIVRDLRFASELMLRLAVSVARDFGLKPSDWKDINEACGNAVRSVPACYRLQRQLPGALNRARALRHIPLLAFEDLNPWKSDEGQEVFEHQHNIDWGLIEAVTAKDAKPRLGFSGVFTVADVAKHDEVFWIHLCALRASGKAPEGFPVKPVQEGDAFLWETDASVGSLLEKGFFVSGRFIMVATEVCFMSELSFVAPSWAPSV